MSRSLSHTYPHQVAEHPQLEPEVKRAILASWASDRAAVPDYPHLRKPDSFDEPIPLDDVLSALKKLDNPDHH
ncbi:hypothetical protein GRI97_15940 [Altererythrobacter xixiisoli]|uniref:Uncharacterized protein n=1 Tax=Croceibacterium xixiisoli TaxID=1476466 RepID=A0A6I4TYV3_9SPHN|nr:hypothetical protein [Croceibacterium xixiisoli]MXP00481.1 hypothetical protein [Croceibacterium xixiisoli]